MGIENLTQAEKLFLGGALVLAGEGDTGSKVMADRIAEKLEITNELALAIALIHPDLLHAKEFVEEMKEKGVLPPKLVDCYKELLEG